MANKTISADMILKWNSMREASKGKDYYYIFDIQNESLWGGKWLFTGHYGISFDPYGLYYLKEVRGTWYLYLERRNGEKQRFLLQDDLEKSFFGITAYVQ